MARQRSTNSGALVDAAAAVFESKGYRNATIDDIADAAGVSRPTVYKYTDSKRALLDSIVHAVCDDLDAQLEAVHRSREPAERRMRQFIDIHIRSAVQHKRFYAILFSEQVELTDSARHRFHRFSDQVAEDFQTLLDECVVLRASGAAIIDTRVATNLILSMLTSLYRWYDASGPITPDALIGQIEALLSAIIPQTEDAQFSAPPM